METIIKDKEFYTEEQIQKLKVEPNKKHYSLCELYPKMFDNDKDKNFDENMDFIVAIIWLGSYVLKSNLFTKQVCPVCGKEEIIPYHLVASVLSGGNLFKGYCLNCHTKLAYSDHEQYLQIKDYIKKNKSGLIDTNKIEYKKI